MKALKSKNGLWPWVVSLMSSLSIVWFFQPTNFFELSIEVGIIGLISFCCGFGLSFNHFKTFKARFFGGLFFAGSSLFLVSCISFLGCFTPPPRRYTPAELQELRRKEALQTQANVERHMVPRASDADSSLLDLTPFYNGLLPGQRSPASPKLRWLNPGIHVWNGSKFDVRGLVSLSYPWERKLEGIPVMQKCSRIDFLHGLNYVSNTNLVSSFAIHYANGQSETVPINTFVDLGPKQISTLQTNSIVWGEYTDASGVARPSVLFYIKKWNNPFPDEMIETIDFVSDDNHPNAYLIAITLRQNIEAKP
jgi:hypothetical protein